LKHTNKKLIFTLLKETPPTNNRIPNKQKEAGVNIEIPWPGL